MTCRRFESDSLPFIKLLMSYKENLQKIEDSLQSAIDHIKATLIDEHPTNSGDKLVEIADELTKTRHKLIDLLHE